jgi:hypothetical protein
MAARKAATPAKPAGRPKAAIKKTNFSVRIPDEDVARIAAIAEARDWPMAKTIQKLVTAALDAKVLK